MSLKPCKQHAAHAGPQAFQPRADGYCTDACYTLGLETRVRALENVLREITVRLDGAANLAVNERERADLQVAYDAARKVLG